MSADVSVRGDLTDRFENLSSLAEGNHEQGCSCHLKDRFQGQCSTEGGFSIRHFLSTLRPLRPACSYTKDSTPEWPKNRGAASRPSSGAVGSSPPAYGAPETSSVISPNSYCAAQSFIISGTCLGRRPRCVLTGRRPVACDKHLI
jgi:hypothetical protein